MPFSKMQIRSYKSICDFHENNDQAANSGLMSNQQPFSGVETFNVTSMQWYLCSKNQWLHSLLIGFPWKYFFSPKGGSTLLTISEIEATWSLRVTEVKYKAARIWQAVQSQMKILLFVPLIPSMDRQELLSSVILNSNHLHFFPTELRYIKRYNKR